MMSCEKKIIIDLENLSPAFAAMGGIADIVSIAREFFNTSVEKIPVDDLKLEDSSKQLGRFKVSELSDTPGIDITKAIKLLKNDVENLFSLQFSISVPVVKVVKVFKVGNVDLPIKFFITPDEVTWLPVIDLGIDSTEKALDNLKGVKSFQLLPSSASLEEAKSIARANYSDNRVLEAVENSLTKEDLFKKLSDLGVVLYKEIDVENEAKKMLVLDKVVPVQDPLDSVCAYPELVPAPYSVNELKAVEEICCDPPDDHPDPQTPGVVSELENLLANNGLNSEQVIEDFNMKGFFGENFNSTPYAGNLTSAEESVLLEKFDNFLGTLQLFNSSIQTCAKEKENATNNYYWFLEALFLNDLTLAYVESRAFMTDALNGSSVSYEASRNQRLERTVHLNSQEEELFAETLARLFPGTTGDPTAEQLLAVENDPAFQSAVFYIRYQLTQNELAISRIDLLIESIQNNLVLPEFSEEDLLNIQTVELSNDSSVFTINVKFCRSIFPVENIVTNQVGYDLTSDNLHLFVHPLISDEAKMLFALKSDETADVQDYILPMELPRDGLVATEIWNKFYSPLRCDKLFTYQEQGYLTPKPMFDENGNQMGNMTTVKIPNYEGAYVEQAVSEDAVNLKVDREVSEIFWSNLEQKTLQKVLVLLGVIKNSAEYKNLEDNIRSAGENEAKYVYAVQQVYSGGNLPETFLSNFINTYDSVREFEISVQQKLEEILFFIELKKKCIADQEKETEEKSIAFAGEFGLDTNLESSEDPVIKENCYNLLGSDPLGVKPPSDCPGITKNCYWKEYTKLLQLVSVMPIPDVQFLNKRLFRYYPVGLRIPVPIPPGVLPTLALGIPDPMISIPLPIMWKHIITIYTPLGLIVIWITFAGPVPGIYLLYFDEKNDPCFLISPKGPISVPARALDVTDMEEKSLIDYLPIKDTFRINLKVFNNVIGNSKIKISDPDSPSNIISKIQDKLKRAIVSLEEVDPDYKRVDGTEEEKKNKREWLKRIREAVNKFPPDVDAVSYAFQSIEKVIDDSVDSMKISPIKFPKNSRKLSSPPVGPNEFTDSTNDLADAGAEPSEIGVGSVKVISLREKMKKLMDRSFSDPDVKEELAKNDEELAIVEDSSMPETQKKNERVKKSKKSVKYIVEKIADNITPEMLGFVAMFSVPIPSPVPCFNKTSSTVVPPYVIAILAAIKALPTLMDSLSDKSFGDALENYFDISSSLPKMEDVVFFASRAFISFVPDISFPDRESATLIKQVISTSVQNFFKFKIRLPRNGGSQVTVTENMIKGVVKSSVKVAFGIVTGIIIQRLVESTDSKDIEKVATAAALIKGVFGTDLGSVSGTDIKSLLASMLGTINQELEQLNDFLAGTQLPSVDFKSIKENLFPSVPPKNTEEGPFLEVDTRGMLAIADPLLMALDEVPIPYQLVLLGCAIPPTRVLLSKIHPFSAKELLPSWEKLTLENVPFVIWLDELAATAQRQGGMGSDYVIPYYLPDI